MKNRPQLACDAKPDQEQQRTRNKRTLSYSYPQCWQKEVLPSPSLLRQLMLASLSLLGHSLILAYLEPFILLVHGVHAE